MVSVLTCAEVAENGELIAALRPRLNQIRLLFDRKSKWAINRNNPLSPHSPTRDGLDKRYGAGTGMHSSKGKERKQKSGNESTNQDPHQQFHEKKRTNEMGMRNSL